MPWLVIVELARVLGPGGLLLIAVHAGTETLHPDALWDIPVDIDWNFLEPEPLFAAVAAAGLVPVEQLVRWPYPDVEHRADRGARHPLEQPAIERLAVELVPQLVGVGRRQAIVAVAQRVVGHTTTPSQRFHQRVGVKVGTGSVSSRGWPGCQNERNGGFSPVVNTCSR